MSYYVYIIESEKDGSYYKGFSESPLERLRYHNEGGTSSTRHLIPWKLIYVEELATKREALIRERNLKKATRERIGHLIQDPKNILKEL